MAEVINLRQARKKKARGAADATAACNRLRHGRTKAERAIEETQRERAVRDLDAHKRECLAAREPDVREPDVRESDAPELDAHKREKGE
jgi:hypothetical protein